METTIKILVVDDESRMRKLVKDFLVKKGYTVLEAGDGVEAVDVQRLLPSVMDRSAWSWSSLSNQATVTLAAYVTPAEDTAVASLKASIYSTAGKLLGESELHVTNAYEEPQLWQGDIQSFANTKSDGVSIVYRLTDAQGHTFYFKEDKMLDGMPE